MGTIIINVDTKLNIKISVNSRPSQIEESIASMIQSVNECILEQDTLEGFIYNPVLILKEVELQLPVLKESLPQFLL